MNEFDREKPSLLANIETIKNLEGKRSYSAESLENFIPKKLKIFGHSDFPSLAVPTLYVLWKNKSVCGHP